MELSEKKKEYCGILPKKNSLPEKRNGLLYFSPGASPKTVYLKERKTAVKTALIMPESFLFVNPLKTVSLA